MQERTNSVSTALLFFTLELNRLDEADLEAKLSDPALAHYRPWLRDIRAFRSHQLSDEIEKLLHEKYVAGRASWMRLFDQTIADLRFPFRGKELTEPEALDLLSDKDPEVRRRAVRNIGIFGGAEGGDTLISIYNSQADIDTKKEVINALFLNGAAKQMVALARKETNPELKKAWIQKLSLMSSPEITEYMMEILNK